MSRKRGGSQDGKSKTTVFTRTGSTVTQAVRTPILTIPSETEGSADFKQRLAALFAAQSTHIYIDTSFLMWMTKVGSRSRQELIGWIQQNCTGRVHVPIWAAHEYLKHHVAETIVKELTEKTKEVDGLVGHTYAYFRPFIDEPFGEGAEDPSTIRTAARAALNTLGRLATISRKWKKSYQRHAAEVIAFINEVTPEQTSVYEHLDDITRSGAGRFIGSVPPGYKDRRKKGSGPQSNGPKDEAPIDSNRYGDLVFWKELLVHAKRVKATALVVVTNDRKTDWHMGRSDVIDIDPELLALKSAWKPVPRPHPMLVMEAKLVAGVDQVELLDSVYLAAFLRDVAENEVRAFADVAIIPDGPEPEKEGHRRAKILKERIAKDTAKVSAEAAEKGYLFSDAPKVLNTRSTLSRALYESRNIVDEGSKRLLEGWRTSVEAKRPLLETITSEMLDGFDHNNLASLARELHDRVLQETPGYEEAVADLVSILDRLPPNTAAALYLGLLSSMYLDRKSNASRLPPSSPVAQLLFERQSADYALNGVHAIAKRLSDNEVTPLYIPNSDVPPVGIALDTEPDTPTTDQLLSLRVGEVELLTAAQSDPFLRLSVLFGSDGPVGGAAIIQKACELFAMPIAQIKRKDLFDQSYALTKMVGFKRPIDISIPKERSDGK